MKLVPNFCTDTYLGQFQGWEVFFAIKNTIFLIYKL